MENIFVNNYAIEVKEKMTVDGKEGFKNGEYTYFTILSQNKEAIHMEQAALAYFLAENGYSHTAYPIKNIHGNWFTEQGEHKYIALRTHELQYPRKKSHGSQLADFHLTGSHYKYQPETISSYGQWKKLWIKKLTAFEQHIASKAKTKSNNYYRLLMDVLPYIAGISENAIQYVQETMDDTRYSEIDRGTITFRRYGQQLQKPVIWTDDLVYDHPMRDIAEYIRRQLYQERGHAEAEVASLLRDYQYTRPLSVFSWRLLYARLLFPIPFFDLIEKSFYEENDEAHFREMLELLDQQAIYEQNLGSFYQMAGMDHEALGIPVLNWL